MQVGALKVFTLRLTGHLRYYLCGQRKLHLGLTSMLRPDLRHAQGINHPMRWMLGPGIRMAGVWHRAALNWLWQALPYGLGIRQELPP